MSRGINMKKENEEEGLINRFDLSESAIAQALASDFICTLFVDSKTGKYIEFVANDIYHSLNLPKSGDNFFDINAIGLSKILYIEDKDVVTAAFNKENIVKVLEVDKSFSLIFRVLFHNKPYYCEFKITKMINDQNHYVVGIKNVNAHMKRLEQYENNKRNHLTFAGIAEALAADYIALFYVNTKDDVYQLYSCSERFKLLGINEKGTRIFTGPDGLTSHIYKEDLLIYKAACNKENILKVLSVDKSFALTLRMVDENEPKYVRIKVTRMMLEDEFHVVIGISNIDDQMRREENYAKSLDKVKEIAYRDSLTGVKSKHAYTDNEIAINDSIKHGHKKDFAVLVCDINNLKKVNDTFGHKVGDEYLKASCALICKTFKHSSVYRVGGDEFVVIIDGDDYQNRKQLVKEINIVVEANHTLGKPSISIGLADFCKENDKCLHDLFERADHLMYQRKRELKAERIV